MNSGKDLMIDSNSWGWDNKVSNGGLTLITPSLRALEILDVDYPTYKFFGQ
jgi:hypothetical protein